MVKKSEGLIKDSYELVIKEIQTFLTVSYLIMIGIGMLFNSQKYSEFEINIFQYSSLFDYLISPFEDLRIIIFSFFTLIFTYLIFYIDKWMRRKTPKLYSIFHFGLSKKSWFDFYLSIIFTIVFIFYLLISADFYGKVSKKNILLQDKVTIKYVDDKEIEGILIGKTTDVLFLKREEKIVVIPYTSVVKEIIIKK